MHWTEYVKIFVAVLVIVDPFGALFLFVMLTGDQTVSQRRRTARTAAIAVALTLSGSALFGEWLMLFLGIRIPSFQVGGGILILLMAIAMLYARLSPSSHVPEEAAEAAEKESIAIVPIAIPLLAGPGAISMMIIYASQGVGPFHYGFLVLTSLLIAVIVWITLRTADALGRMLGRTGVNIVTRVMGLFLTAIAVEFIAEGMVQLFPGLLRQ